MNSEENGEDRTLSEYDVLFDRCVNKSKNAVVDDKRIFTYEELCSEIKCFSSDLSKKNILPGERIAIVLPNSVEYVISYFSNNYLGTINVPIDYDSMDATITSMIKSCGVSCVITDEIKYKSIRNCLDDDITLVIFKKDHSRNFVVPKKNIKKHSRSSKNFGDVSLIVYTTGTTGEKKGVMLTDSAVLHATKAINKVMEIPEFPIELLAMPLSRSFGLARMRCTFMMNGTLVLSQGLLNPAIFIKQLMDHKISGFGLVPFGIRLLLSRFSKYLHDLSPQIKYIEMGSEPFSASEKDQLQKLMPHTKIFMHFGLTEASRATFMDFRDRANLESVGQPTPGTKIKICDNRLKDLGKNETGTILIHSKWLTKGYWGIDSNQYFKDGWLITDDIGMLDEKGYLYFISRESEMLNYKAYNFSPLEIENILNKHKYVENSCVVTRDHKSGILAFIVSNKKNNTLIRELKDKCRDSLESYKVPSEIMFVDTIERSSTGKIKRNFMKEKYAA